MEATLQSDCAEPLNKQFSVNWSNHMNHVRSAFHTLFAAKEFVDVTLYCEGRKIGAHKMLLSACSTYFREVFRDNPCQHPVVILKGVQCQILQDILNFMYNGEVSIDSNSFDAFIKTAQLLQISGLTETASLTETPVPDTSESSDKPKWNRGNNNEDTYQTEFVEGEPDNGYFKKSQGHPDEPAEKKQRRNPKICNIKCEPIETIQEEQAYDPLQEQGIHEEPASDEDDTTASTYSPHEFKEDKVNFDVDGLFVASDTVSATPIRQSAFEESSLKCTICQKVFSHPYSLHHHKAVHSGSTECPICHAVLARKYNLKIHMKARHHI